jgi:type I restriction enzyme, S subunit
MINKPPYQYDIPQIWRVAEAKFLYEIKLGKMLQPEPTGAAIKQTPYLRAANVQWGKISLNDIATMYASEGEIEELSVKNGDLLVCEGGEVGRAAIYNETFSEKLIIQNALHLVRSRNNSCWYLYYLLRHIAGAGWFDVLCNKATIAHFTVEKFGELRLAYPTFEIQTKIADYLDRKTADLDQLLGAKQRLLKLLDEKKRTLIARAVTRGLNHDIPLKDSGIPWLGMIPAHWEVKRINTLFKERDERGRPELPLLVVSIHSGVTLREFSNDKIEQQAADFNTYKVALKGDISFNKMRMWQGAVGCVPCDGLVSPDYVVAEPCEIIYSDYYGMLFKTPMFSDESACRSHGIVWDRLRLYWDEFKDISVPVPPLSEQKNIVAGISSQQDKLNKLKAITEKTITLLQERRTALISAAVTGKLDEKILNAGIETQNDEPVPTQTGEHNLCLT